MINFIPNDPLAVGDSPMRRVAARPNRPAGRAGITVVGDAPEGLYQPGEDGFVQWQARQAAILTLEAWEKALDAPIKTWAEESANPKSLEVDPDVGEDINAYYTRRNVEFYHKFRDGDTTFSGASTDVVSHEVGHAMLDAIRPDLWGSFQLEIGGFHEAFGDIVAIVTALADRKTRDKLLAVAPNLGTANFVEATAEDLSDTIRRVLGLNHPAAKPRRALNTFKWQLPETMPRSGGPDVMIAEVHSMARIITGCFYDLVRGIFAASGSPTQARLWSATSTAARLFYHAAQNAPAFPRFFRSVGRAMTLADETLHAGANGQLIKQAFAQHGLALGSQALLAPELALAGGSPKVDRRKRAVKVQPATLRDLRERFGAPAGRHANVALVELGDTAVANVALRDEVPLDDVDPRLRGVVAPVDTVALVGDSGGSAALLFAPRAGAPSAEVLNFVNSLVANGQVAFDSPPPRRRGMVASYEDSGAATHAIRRRGGKQELERIRFACKR
jgi:hypothetical protein